MHNEVLERQFARMGARLKVERDDRVGRGGFALDIRRDGKAERGVLGLKLHRRSGI